MPRKESTQSANRNRFTVSVSTDVAEPLQQTDRTCVLYRGRKLVYFAGCDYLRLASHTDVHAAVRDGLERFGLNVAASRKTTGNHRIYERLENALARFAAVPAATLLTSGYVTNLVTAQALAGEFEAALIDERAHSALYDAAAALDCPVLPFAHRDVREAARVLPRTKFRGRVLLLTDGLFSHSGAVAPLDHYLRELPKRVTMLVDDAHGFGILGHDGRGTLELLGVPPSSRVIQTITLSKAAGVYGGAVLGSHALRQRILARSRQFTGNTPLPPPLAAGALAALGLLRQKGRAMRRRLHANAEVVKEGLRSSCIPVPSAPGPIIALHPVGASEVTHVKRELLAAGIFPPFIRYGTTGDSYFRFVISSEHRKEQLDQLVNALIKCAGCFRH